jgi:Uma2 family endonuclease
MSIQPKRFIKPEEYLERERAAEHKSEYFNGEMFAMAGASQAHNLITLNVGSELRQCLRGRPCETYANDMRVRVKENGLYTYPDVTIVCDQPKFDDEEQDTLLNPTVIVEVLSPSTEAYDRGAKFALYRPIESLQEYILVSQDRRHIDQFVRQPNGTWALSDADGEEAEVFLPSIDCRLRLADVYERVELTAPAARPDGTQPR